MHFHQIIHKYLLEYREKYNSNFNFLVRQRTSLKDKNYPGGKFAHGLVFQGTEKYCFIALSDKSGGVNATKSIGIVIHPTKNNGFKATFEIVFPGETDLKLIAFYKDLASKFIDINWDSKEERAHLQIGEFPADDPTILYKWLDIYFPVIRETALQTGIEKLIPNDERFNSLQENLQLKVKEAKAQVRLSVNMNSETINGGNEIAPQKAFVNKGNIPLNQIFYGPPGTGKTYATKEMAVAIINDGFIKNLAVNLSEKERRQLITKEYESYRNSGQIVFTTFHQSMSYEDFVEGIKPKTEDKKVTYEVEDGVFKLISDIAKDNWEAYNNRFEKEVSFDVAFNQLKEEWEEDETIKFPMKTDGNNFTIIGFTNKSIQFKKASGGTGHTLSINTLREGFYNERKIRPTGVGIYYPPILEHLKKSKFPQEEALTLKKYVLIIDEINRGNVSAVFGELITLLEDDKRLGEDEAVKIKLPYSKEENFGVPSNIYIIGTMNTADRSVEALDTALRRRFSFTEVAPDITILPEKKIDSIHLRELLKTINERIELLIDKDHKIGHSYFLNIKTIEDLKQTFKNSVIPLLEEYFFGDYGKIGLVLGSDFIELQEQDKKVSFAKNFTEKYEDAESLREKSVYIFTDEKSWSAESFISIYKA
tara:strand:+ start:388 stop:2337 length:1950 start_codon:yes stop_codon:yes gene_type:complete